MPAGYKLKGGGQHFLSGQSGCCWQTECSNFCSQVRMQILCVLLPFLWGPQQATWISFAHSWEVCMVASGGAAPLSEGTDTSTHLEKQLPVLWEVLYLSPAGDQGRDCVPNAARSRFTSFHHLAGKQQSCSAKDAEQSMETESFHGSCTAQILSSRINGYSGWVHE